MENLDRPSKGAMEIMRLFFTPDEVLYDRPITDFFSHEVLDSNFWLYWRTMFAFENWHSALEMKLYIRRYIHHIGGLPDFSALRFTRYNQYESMILPMVKYLERAGVQFHYNTKVTDIRFEISAGKKIARQLHLPHYRGKAGPRLDGGRSGIPYTWRLCGEFRLGFPGQPRRLLH